MPLFDMKQFASRSLLGKVRQAFIAAWAMGVLIGLCLAMLVVKEDQLAGRDLFFLLALSLGLGGFLLLQYWWLTAKVMPELARRCVAPEAPGSDVDRREDFRRQQRWVKPGFVLFLSTIPAGILAYLLGYPPFTESGLPTLWGWLLLALFAVPGLVLMMLGAFCPACHRLVVTGDRKSGRCPHCGARVADGDADGKGGRP